MEAHLTKLSLFSYYTNMFEKQSFKMYKQKERNVYQYAVVDGLLEMAFGVALILISLAVLLATSLTSVFPPLIFLPVFLLIPLLFIAVNVVKKRITYPRTGYIRPHYSRHLTRYIIPVALVVLLLAINMLLARPQPFLTQTQILLFLAGGLTTVALLWLGAGVRRFYYLSAISFLLTLGFAALSIQSPLVSIVFCGLMGTVLLISGLVVLRQYTRNVAE